jgi:DNA-binding IclR family transcriptional regulator
VRGIAAPIFDNRRNVLGSLSITMAEKGIDARRLRVVADRVMFCARVVTTTIAGAGPA